MIRAISLTKNNFAKAFLFLFLFWTVSSWAATPVEELQGIANRMIQSLEANKSRLNNRSVIKGIVNRNLLPYVDLDRMSASVVQKYWRSATSAQKSEFKREFAALVTSTYASALASYNNDTVKFFPSSANGSFAKVRSVIIRSNGQRIPVNYEVERVGNQWKVFDFSIENVSMVQSYRAQFAGVLANSGMNGLLDKLRNHNRQ